MATKPLAQGQSSINVAAERNDKYVTVTVKYRTLAACSPGLHAVGGPIMNAMIEAAQVADMKVLADQRPDDVRTEPVLDGSRVVTKWLVDPKDGLPQYIVDERPATDEDADLTTLSSLIEAGATV